MMTGRYFSVTQPYLERYLLQEELVCAPDGYTVRFRANGGSEITRAGEKIGLSNGKRCIRSGGVWMESNISFLLRR